MNRRRCFLPSLLLILVAAVASRAQDIDDYLKSQLQARHIPAISVAVLKNGAVIKQRPTGSRIWNMASLRGLIRSLRSDR
jgi:hypothetical protein